MGQTRQPAGLRQSRSVLPQVELTGAGPRLLPCEEERFAALGPLGEGGMGEVLLVEDRDIRRRVAVKRIKPGQDSPDAIVRFIEEVRTIGQLDHPGIAPIHDVGVDEAGRYFFVMKYVEGEGLDVVIERLRAGDERYRRRFSFEARRQIFMQVLRVIQFAHSKGILHRDLKPANIMVGPYGEVLVIDWGLARRLGAAAAVAAGPPSLAQEVGPLDETACASQTRAGALVGTPLYMSPEQVRGDALDARSDIYSLCALLYEFLTLQHYLPPQDSLAALLSAVLTAEPPGALAIHHRYKVPPELAHFVRRGLHKDPAARYQSVDEMIERLQAISEGEIPVQCPCTTIKRAGGRFSRFIDEHPNLALLACLLLAVLCLSGAAHLLRDMAALVAARG